MKKLGFELRGVRAIDEKIKETDAKQGIGGKRVLTILIAGIALCLLAFGMLELFQGGGVDTAS